MKDYIIQVTQKILDKEFASLNRRRIVEYHDRINICCPYCGDGKSEYKKRGNLYFNKLFFICFNCDKKTTFDHLAKDFNEALDPQRKLEIINHLNEVMSYQDYDTDMAGTDLSDLHKLEDILNAANVRKVTPFYDLQPIVKDGGIYKYLIGRGIPPEYHHSIYQAKYEKADDQFEHVIVFLNKRGDDVLGLQVRNLKEGKRRFFVIYNWENINEWIHGEVEVEMTKAILYNKLSYFFNILNINLEKRITIFEGYLDSLFYPNSIGVIGVNTDMKFIENNNLEIQYFFDNDEAGYSKSEEKLKVGGQVFLWQKLFQDIVLKKKKDDPYQLYNRISKVKDLNKLAELIPNPYSKFELYNYFSQEMGDIRYLPKKKKYDKNKVQEKDYNKIFKDYWG